MENNKKKVVIYSANEQLRKQGIIRLNIALLFLLTSLTFLLTVSHINFYLPKSINKRQIADAQVKATIIVPTPTSTVTPTLTPTPTIVPTALDGDFCLRVPVLFYHHIEPYNLATQEGHAALTVDSGYFDEQMNYLKTNGYKSISAEDLVHALINHQQVPPKSVVVTMDDGYIDIYQYAFPILKKYNIIGSLMIPAGLIGNPDYMTWSQLQEMIKSPYIKIYNHTYSHADVSDATEEKMNAEIVVPNNEFQSKLGGNKIDVFTYPYGAFSDTTITFLEQHGFIAAFSTLPGTLECQSEIMKLPRDRIGNAPLSEYGF